MLAVAVGVHLAATGVSGARGLTVDDMLAMQRVGSPAVSPDHRWVAYAVRDTDLDANRGRYDVWMTSIDGRVTKRMTTHPENDSDPAWSPDGRWIYFLSSRSGKSQVWRISPTGGEAQQVTDVPADLNGYKIIPDRKDGAHLVLAIDVWPQARSLAESNKIDEAKAKSKSTARIYDQLLFRHWDTWEDGKFSHLFAWSPDRPVPLDLTRGQTTDTPIHPFDGMEDVTVSPDGRTVMFIRRDGGREVAWRTDTNVYAVSTRGGRLRRVTKNPAYDFEPSFSPDGKWVAARMQTKPGFEADRERIAIYDARTFKRRVVTEAWDRTAGEIAWAPDGKTIYTSADNIGSHSIFAIDVATGKAKLLVNKGTNHSIQVAGDRLVYSHDALDQPAELYTIKLDGSEPHQITHLNDRRVKKIQWGAYQQFSFKGAHGDTVYGYAIKPAGYRAGKVPIAFLIHGGPQGSFGDHFHYRWNPESYAGHGYGVVMIDFHGSTGYGQKFTDAITNDWGGAPYEDLMKGLDFAIQKFPWLDGKRAVALGASYGGYMINYINGKTDRFKALVVHDGNLDERMAYFDTEELWFPEWEHHGLPWNNVKDYTKHSPLEGVKNWKTPTLVIHGGRDYRVADTQGMSVFTALQRMGIPSRFIYFPDENHWVLKPANSKLWHDEVLAWIDKYSRR